MINVRISDIHIIFIYFILITKKYINQKNVSNKNEFKFKIKKEVVIKKNKFIKT